MTGPLDGLRVIEIASIGPGPFCAMLLADLGAEVLRIDRPVAAPLGTPIATEFDLTRRNRRSVAVDLAHEDGAEVVLRLVERAHVLIEGFRPGVAERLGIGPDVCLVRNPELVYGRMRSCLRQARRRNQANRRHRISQSPRLWCSYWVLACSAGSNLGNLVKSPPPSSGWRIRYPISHPLPFSPSPI